MQIQSFNFQANSTIRTIQQDGATYLVAKDVCDALDYTWSGSQRIAHVPAEWRGVTSVVTPSGTQSMAILSESGLYFFLSRSDKPKALAFQKWIAGDVIPAIRRNGVYIDESHLKVKAAQPDMFAEPTPTAPDFSGMTAIPELVLLRQLYATQTRLVELLEAKCKPKAVRVAALPITPEEVAMARAMKSQGLSSAAIGRQLKRSTAAISFITRELH